MVRGYYVGGDLRAIGLANEPMSQDGLNKKLNLEKLGLGGNGNGSGGLLPNLVPGQQGIIEKPDAKELLKGIGDLFS